MQVQIAANQAGNVASDILVFGLAGRGSRSPGWRQLTKILGGNPATTLKMLGWSGNTGDFVVFPAPRGTRARMIAVGTLARRGKVEDTAVWGLAQRIGALARTNDLTKAAFFLDPAMGGRGDVTDATYEAIGAGLGYGGYVFDAHLGTKNETAPIDSVYAYFSGRRDREAMADAVLRGAAIARAQNRARTLVNEPANIVNPESYVEMARALADEHGLEITVLDSAACEERGMGAFLAVGQGGGYESNLVHLAWKPEGATQRVVLVGKAVTFDSGGLCIKPAAGQALMKMDMGGSAAVFGAIAAVAALELPVEVHAIFAACENMTGSKAYHTGDVLTASNGKTIEVLNTDAEGRLTLADALVYAGELKPDYLIDLATLTGACIVALGMNIAGIMGTNRSLVRALKAAGDTAGEPMWELPLPPDYKELLKSKVADMKNIGGRWGGAITAGLFLSEFVPEGVPWAHIDIAGPCFVESPTPTRPYGGTGFPVRALVQWMRGL